MDVFEIGIWLTLSVLGYGTGHALIERLIFHSRCRLADRSALDDFSGRLKDLPFSKAALTDMSELGWLAPLVIEARTVRKDLKSSIYNLQAVAERFGSFQITMENVGGALGLLGTVMAFVSIEGGTQNFAEQMPLAFKTTFAGLLISIPAMVVTGILGPRVDTILDQTDLVLAAINDGSKHDEPTMSSDADYDNGQVAETHGVPVKNLPNQSNKAMSRSSGTVPQAPVAIANHRSGNHVNNGVKPKGICNGCSR